VIRRSLACILCLAPLGCAADPEAAWCASNGALEVTCAGPHCVALIVVDYARLEPRGYALLSLEGSPVAREEADAKAVEHLLSIERVEPPDQRDCSPAGDFFNCFLSYDSGDSWLVVIHTPSGKVVFAGLEVWGDPAQRGHDLALQEWISPPGPLGCTDGAGDPAQRRFVTTGSPISVVPPSTAAEAWEVARRVNLTEAFTAGFSYQVMVVSFAPATGEFDAEAADWYVWLTRR
jgi:hypothetical protein